MAYKLSLADKMSLARNIRTVKKAIETKAIALKITKIESAFITLIEADLRYLKSLLSKQEKL